MVGRLTPRGKNVCKVVRVPYISHLEENSVRKGFLEDSQYLALLAELPEYMGAGLAFACCAGCRKMEILSLL